MASAWGLELYGHWLMLATIPVFLGSSDFGFGVAAGNRIIGEVATGSHPEALRTFQSALALIASASAVMMLAVVAALLLLPTGLLAATGGMSSDAAAEVLLVLSLYGLVAMQGSLFMAVIRAEGGYATTGVYDATLQLVEAAAVIAVVSLGNRPIDAALTYLMCRSAGFGGLIVLTKYRARWLRLGFGLASMDRIRVLLRPAIAAMMLPLGFAGFLQGTALAVGAAGGAAAVPIYTSLRTLSRIGLQAIMAVNLPIMPEFTAEFAKGNDRWITRVAGGMATFAAIAGIAWGLALALLGPFALAIWTRGTIEPPQAMYWLTGAAIAMGAVWNPLSNFLLAVNRHESFTYAFAIATVAVIGATIPAVHLAGVTGAAAVALLLDLFMLIFVVFSLRRLIGPFRLGWEPLLACLPSRFRPARFKE
ncbi:hypothetical protein [Novosphingobium sp.]|uniref:hypothetical protein n=1 Tax=Novosphingobium sp. TaxID=1874826 RepID=UPI002734FEDA|nr:hypothetical protein [Novosphingobium sp.]MDP3906648.1 hypothetical protein [Novosphingobium sp.]